MRILHTADWHLGKRLDGFSRAEEQREVLREIVDIADREQVDAVLIAGDLFDTFNPPTEATELFYQTLKRLACNGKRPVVAIAGNHDSPDRIEAPDPLARECGIIFAGHPHSVVSPFSLDCGLHITRSEPGFLELRVAGIDFPLRLLLTPYANEFRLRTYLGNTPLPATVGGTPLPATVGDLAADLPAEPVLEESPRELRQVLAARWQSLADAYCDEKGANVLLAHLYLMKKDGLPPEEPDDERPIAHVGGAQAVYSENVPAQIQYVALGHLHRQQVIDTQPCPVVYSSSPLAYSFGEANQTKYVVLVDVHPGQPARYRPVPLSKGRKLLRGRCEGVEAAVRWLQQNPTALVELTVVSDTYLTAPERKRVYGAHDGIVALIPEVRGAQPAANRLTSLDLGKGMEELFTQYFKHKHTQAPNDRLIDLFREVLSEGASEEEA
ncbi:MAG: exonuclease SbcCD subunit D [Ferruginibacter sp.]|nr:exonuclease SbcCD subunit D [Cytophagales bacterium]